MLGAHALGNCAGVLEVGHGGLDPEQVGVLRVLEAAGDDGLDAVLRSPVTKGRSRSSTSLVSRVAASESVRAMMIVGTSATSEARRAAFRVRMCWLVGTSTLPPMWPHFFSLASWSSQCTPAAPAAIIWCMSSYALSGPPKPASASATTGANQSRSFVPVSPNSICAARCSALFTRRTTCGTEFAG
jgi:hypothetical protein